MRDVIEKADILIEALPYIRSFRDKIIVVKYGGSTIGDEGSVLVDVVFMETVGMKPVIVHGGGKLISRRMEESGIETKFVNGLRVTDGRTMKIVESTLIGEVNRDIVRTIERLGGKALGISAKERGVLRVRKHLEPVGGDVVDIGYVGDVESVDPEPILEICRSGAIPVVAPVGLGPDGKSYNVNADTAAGHIAAALKAEKLVFLTDVIGVLEDPLDEGTLISTVRVSEVDELIERGIISGGMIPKMRACLMAVSSGVRKTHIISGKIRHSLLLEIFTDRGVGTQIVV